MRIDQGRRMVAGAAVLAVLVAGCTGGDGDEESPRADINFSAADAATAADRLAAGEFQPSTLTPEEQKAELAWFTKAAEPYRGLEISVVSETITTHEYESQTLA